MLQLRSLLRPVQLSSGSRALHLPPRLRPPPLLASRPPNAFTAPQGRGFASFRDTLMSITSRIADPFISSVFDTINRNEAIGLRLEKFSKRFPDWIGPAAFIEGCSGALQVLFDITNNRCCAAPFACTAP